MGEKALQHGLAKPTILLFLGTDDAKNCCAINFERVVFKDARVVELAKSKFQSVRVDRHSSCASPFHLSTVAIVILNAEGNETGRFTECTRADDVLAVLEEASIGKAREKTSEWSARLARIDGWMSSGKYAECVAQVDKGLKDSQLPRGIREQLVGYSEKLDSIAEDRLSQARTKDANGDSGTAWTIFRKVKRDFAGRTAAQTAQAHMAKIEKDPAKREKIKDARAQDALEDARELAESGKKPEAIELLKRVQSDFPGTKAATEAASFLTIISDPNWKPAPRPVNMPKQEKPNGTGCSDAPDVPAPEKEEGQQGGEAPK